jgi:hypothetical protein
VAYCHTTGALYGAATRRIAPYLTASGAGTGSTCGNGRARHPQRTRSCAPRRGTCAGFCSKHLERSGFCRHEISGRWDRVRFSIQRVGRTRRADRRGPTFPLGDETNCDPRHRQSGPCVCIITCRALAAASSRSDRTKVPRLTPWRGAFGPEETMSRLFPSTFTRCAELPGPLAAPVDSGSVSVRVRLGPALRFCAAALFGLAIVVGAIGVWAAAAVAIAVVGDTPSRRSF